MYPGRAPSIQNPLRVKHDIHCRILKPQLLLGIIVVIIIIIIIIIIVFVIVIIFVIVVMIIMIIMIIIIMIMIIIIIIIQVGRLFSANCVVNVVRNTESQNQPGHTQVTLSFFFSSQ